MGEWVTNLVFFLMEVIVMNKKGFTLVELMVVIVIIGVLAAVAMPKFADAINKARAAEAPVIVRQIYTADVPYYAENGEHIGIGETDGSAPDPSGSNPNDLFLSLLGINTTSRYFTYLSTAGGTGSTAAAFNIEGTFGGLEDNAMWIAVDGNGKKMKDSNGNAAKYIPAWK